MIARALVIGLAAAAAALVAGALLIAYRTPLMQLHLSGWPLC